MAGAACECGAGGGVGAVATFDLCPHPQSASAMKADGTEIGVIREICTAVDDGSHLKWPTQGVSGWIFDLKHFGRLCLIGFLAVWRVTCCDSL